MATQPLKPVGATLYASGVVVAWIGTVINFPSSERLMASHDRLAMVPGIHILGHPFVVVLMTLGLGYALWSCRDPSRRVLALMSVFMLFLLYGRVEGTAPEGITHGKFLPSVTALALAIGVWWGRRREHRDGGERLAVSLAAGVVATLYVWAGVVKLSAGGLEWAQNANVAMLVYERSFYGPTWVRGIRHFVGTHPALGPPGAVMVMAVELGGVVFVRARWRVVFAVAATLMHSTLFLLVGYHYIGWALSVWGLALWSVALLREDAEKLA